ncbi:MAG TPA: glycosyl transferase family 2, partial [Sulfurospirillum sp. UBA11407]
GKIGYIDEATIKYRQHTSNTIGAKGFDISFVLKNIVKKVSLGRNISQAKAFLEQYKDELDVDTIKMLQDFTALEQKRWWQKRLILWKYKLLKQGFIRNVGLFLKI